MKREKSLVKRYLQKKNRGALQGKTNEELYISGTGNNPSNEEKGKALEKISK